MNYSFTVMSTFVPSALMRNGALAKGFAVQKDTFSRPVFSFLGIPYAEPPTHSNRFMPPKPIKIWNGEKSFETFGE